MRELCAIHDGESQASKSKFICCLKKADREESGRAVEERGSGTALSSGESTFGRFR
jgi:hypothetical protein